MILQHKTPTNSMHNNNHFTINKLFDINTLNSECAREMPISLRMAQKNNLSDPSLHRKDTKLILNTCFMC